MKHKQLTKNFNSSEFDSPDKPFSGLQIDQSLVDKLQLIRNSVNRPLRITSGVRTSSHNLKVKGKKDSSHITGKAVDVAVNNTTQRYELIRLGMYYGFTRIGVYKYHIHFDVDFNKPQHVIWYGTY